MYLHLFVTPNELGTTNWIYKSGYNWFCKPTLLYIYRIYVANIKWILWTDEWGQICQVLFVTVSFYSRESQPMGGGYVESILKTSLITVNRIEQQEKKV